MLGAFASKAFRRPVDDAVLERLVKIAEAGYTTEGRGFEDAIRRAWAADGMRRPGALATR